MPGRLLFCTSCGVRVEVHEPQGEYIDPERYVCGDCQIAKTEAKAESCETAGRTLESASPR